MIRMDGPDTSHLFEDTELWQQKKYTPQNNLKQGKIKSSIKNKLEFPSIVNSYTYTYTWFSFFFGLEES